MAGIYVLLIILAIILIVVLVIIVIFVISRRRSAPTVVPRAPTENSSDVSTLYDTLSMLVKDTLKTTKDVPFPGDWPVTGSINNLGLRDLVKGSGVETVKVPVLPDLRLRYSYQLLSLAGLADALNITNVVVTLPPNGPIAVTADITAATLTGYATVTVVGSGAATILTRCANFPITFSGITGKLALVITTDCPSSPTITSAHLTEFTLDFRTVDVSCEVEVTIASGDFETPDNTFFLNINQFNSITQAIRNALPELRPVFDRLINRALTGKSIGVCATLPPAPSCLLGSDVTGKNGSFSLAGTKSATYGECKMLCLAYGSCNYATWDGGRCTLYQRVVPPIAFPQPGATAFDRQTNKDQPNAAYKPNVTAPQTVTITSPISGVTVETCSTTCNALNMTCSGYKYENNTCYLYGKDITLQRATVGVSRCSRNFIRPYTIT